MSDNFDLISMGEIMHRLSPPINERLASCTTLVKRAGGSELNVAAGVAELGLKSAVITKLPSDDIGSFIRSSMRNAKVDDSLVIDDNSGLGRTGIYYYEYGATPRKPKVVYDRRHASFNTISENEINPAVFTKTRLFHTSGITLALSKNNRDTAIEAVKKFKSGGAKISFDVNYRANLWSEEEAKKTIEEILPYIDILFISEETSRRMMGKSGELEEIMKSYTRDYPISYVCTTRRTVKSPKCHDFTSIIYDAREGKVLSEAPYSDIDVIDRIGSGDAYVSGALYGFLKYGTGEKALKFGNAMGTLKNTVLGDITETSLPEITKIINDHDGNGDGSELSR